MLAAPPAPGGEPAAAPPRRPAYRESWDRLRDATTTEPGRLRLIGAGIIALVLVFGALTAWQVTSRQDSARAVLDDSQPLSVKAAEIYRHLADADATAAGGFLAGGQEPKESRERYNEDIRIASTLLAEAAADAPSGGAEQRQIALLNRELPVYTGLVESARANNRQGLPLGGAYLRYASEKMRTTLLPAAERLYQAQTDQLESDYADAEEFPWASIALGAVALGGLVWAQRRLYRRTNRVFNVGLLAASAGTAALLLWLVAGHSVARWQFDRSDDQGARSVRVLSEARISALKARGDENLTLVARGSGAAYEEAFRKETRRLSGDDLRGDTLLEVAWRLADDSRGREAVEDARRSMDRWTDRHAAARASDDEGDYDKALEMVIGVPGGEGWQTGATTGAAFDSMDRSLSRAVEHELAEFRQAADAGRDAFTGLAAGAATLAVLAALGTVLGIGRRLSEYR
ncbi:hypothetical protein GCM10027168_52810 [Streptomyces capparidis]